MGVDGGLNIGLGFRVFLSDWIGSYFFGTDFKLTHMHPPSESRNEKEGAEY